MTYVENYKRTVYRFTDERNTMHNRYNTQTVRSVTHVQCDPFVCRATDSRDSTYDPNSQLFSLIVLEASKMYLPTASIIQSRIDRCRRTTSKRKK